eukprot:g15918.t1
MVVASGPASRDWPHALRVQQTQRAASPQAERGADPTPQADSKPSGVSPVERGGSFSLRRSFRLPQLVAQRVRTLRGTPFPSELCASPLRRFRGFSPGASPPAAGGTGSGGPASGLPVSPFELPAAAKAAAARLEHSPFDMLAPGIIYETSVS